MKIHLLFVICILTLNSSAQYTKLLDFAGAVNGQYPSGDLISDGTSLYGMTNRGGTSDMGIIFKINPDGTGYTKLQDFAGAVNGQYPSGNLISDGTFLYGMTYGGGNGSATCSGCGVVFKIKMDGTGDTTLLNFIGSNGSYPYGSLISDGTFLYGMTTYGGITNGWGTILKIKPNGTGYADLLDFSGPNGLEPNGSLYYDGTFLYGMTSAGGTSSLGVVFKIKPNGTSYSKLLDFAGTANGSSPYGSLISDGTFLYGMTLRGGANDSGIVFKIKLDGTSYSKILDFAGTANGSSPNGSLYYDGTFLYGMTEFGGTNNMGIVFKIKPDGTSYSKLLDFSGVANGSSPLGSLISDGTFFYGMTKFGGINGDGTIFKIDPTGMGISENNAEKDFTIYSNPTSGIFTVVLNGIENLTMERIETYSIYGEKVYSSTVSGRSLTISMDVPNGIYFLQVKTDGGVIVKKIVVSK